MIHGGDVLWSETTPAPIEDALITSAETFTPEDAETNKSGVRDAFCGFKKFLRGKEKIRKRRERKEGKQTDYALLSKVHRELCVQWKPCAFSRGSEVRTRR